MFRSYTQKVLTIVVSISCKRGVIYCLKYETSYGQKLKLSRIFYRTHKFQIRIAYFSPFISLQHTEWSKSSPNTVSPYLPNSEQKWAQSIFRQFAVGSLLKKRSDLKVFLDVSSLFFTPVFCRIFPQESSFRILALKSQIEATYPNQILLRRLQVSLALA